MIESILAGVIFAIVILIAKSKMSNQGDLKCHDDNNHSGESISPFVDFFMDMTVPERMRFKQYFYWVAIFTCTSVVAYVLFANFTESLYGEIASSENNQPKDENATSRKQEIGFMDIHLNEAESNLTSVEREFLDLHIRYLGGDANFNSALTKNMILLKIYAFRKDRPADPDYFFCDAKEFRGAFPRNSAAIPDSLVNIIANERDIRCGLTSSEINRKNLSTSDYVEMDRKKVHEHKSGPKSKYQNVLDRMTPIEKSLLTRIGKVPEFEGKELLSLLDAIDMARDKRPKRDDYLFCSSLEKAALSNFSKEESYKKMMLVIDRVSGLHCENSGISSF